MREIEITTRSIFNALSIFFKGLITAYFAFIVALAGYMLVTNWSLRVLGGVTLYALGFAVLGSILWYAPNWIDKAEKNNRTLFKFGGPKLAKAKALKDRR